MFGGETPISDDKSNILDAYTTIAAQFLLLILAGSLPFWMDFVSWDDDIPN